MEDDERVDSCNHLAPLRVKYIFLDLFLSHWQDSFCWNWRVSSSIKIEYAEFSCFFFSFELFCQMCYVKSPNKEMLTCLGFTASFYLWLPKSLLFLQVMVCKHMGGTRACLPEQINAHHYTSSCGYFGQHLHGMERRMRRPGSYQAIAVWNYTCSTTFVIKELFLHLVRMDGKNSQTSLFVISPERQRIYTVF
jgi:hypothetical protein